MSIARADSLVGRRLDFWLLGGASIAAWGFLTLAEPFRLSNSAVERQIAGLTVTFSFLSLICNYPHFIVSYKLAYGRGFRFIIKNWLPLIIAPLGMLATLSFAHLRLEGNARSTEYLETIQSVIAHLGIYAEMGDTRDSSAVVMSAMVWLMYLMIGWHYAKQVFGSILVYATYDRYPISKRQRNIIKFGLFSLSVTNFIYGASLLSSQSLFMDLRMLEITLPNQWLTISKGVTIGTFAFTIFAVFWRNFRDHGVKPSLNLLVPWIAFHIWWFPWFWNASFYFLMVPFFHSLQYLPFAFRMATQTDGKQGNWLTILSTPLQVLTILVVGFLAFDGIPTYLDKSFSTRAHLNYSFFVIAAAVFINIHHYLMDSTIWKMEHAEVKQGLF